MDGLDDVAGDGRVMARMGNGLMGGAVILFMPWLLYVYGPTIWGKR
jgi:hypothetical protein